MQAGAEEEGQGAWERLGNAGKKSNGHIFGCSRKV